MGEVLCRDVQSLRRDMNRLARMDAHTPEFDKLYAAVHKRFNASTKAVRHRQKTMPRLDYPPELPITEKRPEIVEALKKHRVVVITGETGSGKTTQIPKMCLEAGRGARGVVACTQPRRVAAVTVAKRIAEEMGQEPGDAVGYKIRFTEKGRPDPHVRIMTDGILLAETQGDPWLNRYDTIIVDEAHERSLNIDFTLGILKRLVDKRPDLSLVITSATLDTEKFARAFEAPVIEVSGRTYPVDVVYDPSDPDAADDYSYTEHAAAVVSDIMAGKHGKFGDILVFMPTEADIRETCELLEGRQWPDAHVMPLFARLTAKEQSRVFDPVTGIKIVVSTNVAETSVTIPGIRYVVDTGLARVSRYSPRTRTTSLPITPVSRSSADQRKGRCGRVQDGVCIRLFSEEDYENRPLFTPPEILRANLAEVILRMISLRLGDPAKFGFVDPPNPKAIHDGQQMLLELGAIEETGACGKGKTTANGRHALTEMGRTMARMPLDPRISRILMAARSEGCLPAAVVLAAFLSIMDPRERPSEKETAADQAHAEWRDRASDFSTVINLWRAWHRRLKTVGSQNRMRKFAREKFLNYRRMREWRDVHDQIATILEEEGLIKKSDLGRPESVGEVGPDADTPAQAAVHRAVVAGYLSNIAMQKEKNVYQAARGREAVIFPGSGLYNRGGRWIVAAEIVQTTRLYARVAANIDPDWLEELGGHLCRYHYTEPRFDKKRGEVVATEHVSLYGLPVASGRRVSYGNIDPDEATRVFIQAALVEGGLTERIPFLVHNRDVVARVAEYEDRLRRRDLLLGEEAQVQFYESRLPRVYSVATLKSLIKKKGSDAFLRMEPHDVMATAPDAARLSRFPKKARISGNEFPLRYCFDPGSPADGVTVRIPQQLAGTVDPACLEWVVPGLLRDKVAALVKGLPKQYRKRLVPVNDTVEKLLPELDPTAGSLTGELSRVLHEKYRMNVPHSAWPLEQIEDHLRTRVAILAPNGREVAAGRDPALLSRVPSPKTPAGMAEDVREKWERNGLMEWDFGELPESVPIHPNRKDSALAYLALNPEDGGVAIRVELDPEKARRMHEKGVAELYRHHFGSHARQLRRRMDLAGDDAKLAVYHGGAKALEQAAFEKVWCELFCENVRNREDFLAHAHKQAPRMLDEGARKMDRVRLVLREYHQAREVVDRLERASADNRRVLSFLSGLRNQLAQLVPKTFVSLYGNERLRHVARYLDAVAIRAEKGVVDLERDRARAEVVARYTEKLKQLVAGLGRETSGRKRRAVEDLFWMIEEFKVSLFAQNLKTAHPVSEKRLDKAIEEIERMG
ncbi:MAG: ATP-dependent RNA helicase HrpA [Desulfatibacillaceae bacterium]